MGVINRKMGFIMQLHDSFYYMTLFFRITRSVFHKDHLIRATLETSLNWEKTQRERGVNV